MNLGIVERLAHLRDQALCTLSRLIGRLTALDQLCGFMVFKLVKNDGTPHWAIQALDR